VDKDAVVVLDLLDDPPPTPSAEGGGTPKVASQVVSHAKLGVRELKDLLTAAGVSFEGATEKQDLVRLLTKARAQAAISDGMFVATATWQRVEDGVALPPGLEVKFDLGRGCN